MWPAQTATNQRRRRRGGGVGIIGTGDNPRTEWQAQGDRVGWREECQLYLDPDAAYRGAQQQGGHGDAIPVQSRTLWKRMWDRGQLVTRDENRFTTRKSLEGRRRHVLHLRLEALSCEKVSQLGQVNQYAEKPEGIWPTPVAHFSRRHPRTGPGKWASKCGETWGKRIPWLTWPSSRRTYPKPGRMG